jgi:hypothetical protein
MLRCDAMRCDAMLRAGHTSVLCPCARYQRIYLCAVPLGACLLPVSLHACGHLLSQPRFHYDRWARQEERSCMEQHCCLLLKQH